jgi:hypothetical protein
MMFIYLIYMFMICIETERDRDAQKQIHLLVEYIPSIQFSSWPSAPRLSRSSYSNSLSTTYTHTHNHGDLYNI